MVFLILFKLQIIIISEVQNTKIDYNTFKDIFYTLYPKLFSFCMKYVENEFEAEEIVSECMLYIWEEKKNLEKIRNLKSYLYTMVKNKCYAHLKHNKKIVSIECDVHCSYSLEEEYIIEEEVHSVLIEALNTLPEKCRKVFELSCLEGLKYKEIAEDMNISVNTVKSQRARAIELIKIQLKKTNFIANL